MLGSLDLRVELVHFLAQLSTNGVDRSDTEVSRVAERAAEDVGEGGFRHGFICNARDLGAFTKNWLVEDRVFESQDQFVLASRNLLLLQICKRVISEQRPVGHRHGKEEPRIVVDELFVLTASGAENNVFWVSIILHPPLVNSIYEPPAADRCTLQHKLDIPIPKTIGEEGGQSRPCPAVDANDKGKLNAVAFGNEDEVVLSPQGQQNADQLSGREVVFFSSFVHHQAFLGKDLPHPLATLARLPCNRHLESLAYTVDFTSVFLVSVGPSDPSKTGKEPFRHRIDRVDGGLVCQLRAAGGDVEADEIFHRH